MEIIANLIIAGLTIIVSYWWIMHSNTWPDKPGIKAVIAGCVYIVVLVSTIACLRAFYLQPVKVQMCFTDTRWEIPK